MFCVHGVVNLPTVVETPHGVPSTFTRYITVTIIANKCDNTHHMDVDTYLPERAMCKFFWHTS
jgi:hypothetical protein